MDEPEMQDPDLTRDMHWGCVTLTAVFMLCFTAYHIAMLFAKH